jgi:hypothetical protein
MCKCVLKYPVWMSSYIIGETKLIVRIVVVLCKAGDMYRAVSLCYNVQYEGKPRASHRSVPWSTNIFYAQTAEFSFLFWAAVSRLGKGEGLHRDGCPNSVYRVGILKQNAKSRYFAILDLRWGGIQRYFSFAQKVFKKLLYISLVIYIYAVWKA